MGVSKTVFILSHLPRRIVHMDTSMILGLTLAGLIVTLSGNKSKDKKKSSAKSSNTEVVVRLGDENVVLGSKK